MAKHYGNYGKFFKFVEPNDIKVILEVGTKDCLDGIIMSDYFNAEAHCFECSPQLIEACYQNSSPHKRVFFTPKAVTSKSDELVEFTYPLKLIGESQYWNGMGSLNGPTTRQWFEINKHPWATEDIESFEWGTALVETTTLKDYCENNKVTRIDLLCFDVEGRTLDCLKGLGSELLKTCGHIISETNHASAHDQTTDDLFIDVDKYLQSHDFKLVWEEKKSPVFGNAIWSNRNRSTV